MSGLQIAVGEVGCQLQLPLELLGLLTDQLKPQSGSVLATDAQQLFQLPNLRLCTVDGEKEILGVTTTATGPEGPNRTTGICQFRPMQTKENTGLCFVTKPQ